MTGTPPRLASWCSQCALFLSRRWLALTLLALPLSLFPSLVLLRGIQKFVAEDLFDLLEQREGGEPLTIGVSFFEIYGGRCQVSLVLAQNAAPPLHLLCTSSSAAGMTPVTCLPASAPCSAYALGCPCGIQTTPLTMLPVSACGWLAGWLAV